MAPPAIERQGCEELGSTNGEPSPTMSRQMKTSTCVTSPNSPESIASRIFRVAPL